MVGDLDGSVLCKSLEIGLGKEQDIRSLMTARGAIILLDGKYMWVYCTFINGSICVNENIYHRVHNEIL